MVSINKLAMLTNLSDGDSLPVCVSKPLVNPRRIHRNTVEQKTFNYSFASTASFLAAIYTTRLSIHTLLQLFFHDIAGIKLT